MATRPRLAPARCLAVCVQVGISRLHACGEFLCAGPVLCCGVVQLRVSAVVHCVTALLIASCCSELWYNGAELLHMGLVELLD